MNLCRIFPRPAIIVWVKEVEGHKVAIHYHQRGTYLYDVSDATQHLVNGIFATEDAAAVELIHQYLQIADPDQQASVNRGCGAPFDRECCEHPERFDPIDWSRTDD